MNLGSFDVPSVFNNYGIRHAHRDRISAASRMGLSGSVANPDPGSGAFLTH
jgi:hypothetical protein